MRHPVQCTDLQDAQYVMRMCIETGYFASLDRNTMIVTFWK